MWKLITALNIQCVKGIPFQISGTFVEYSTTIEEEAEEENGYDDENDNDGSEEKAHDEVNQDE